MSINETKTAETRATGRKRVLKSPDDLRNRRASTYLSRNDEQVLIDAGLNPNKHVKAIVRADIERRKQEARRQAHLKKPHA